MKNLCGKAARGAPGACPEGQVRGDHERWHLEQAWVKAGVGPAAGGGELRTAPSRSSDRTHVHQFKTTRI